jgi:cobalt-zinc-cadmium resistance protein CzcA
MLVDSSIVIVENIVSALGHAESRKHKTPMLHLVFRAVKDVAVPVTSGIAIIIIVFLPLLSLEGLEGKLFRPVTLTIVFALLGSLVLSLTLIPVVASYLIKADGHDEPWLSRKLTAIYTPLLARMLVQPKPLLIGAGALLVGSVLLLPLVGKTFMPTMDEGDLIIQLETIPSINLASTTHNVLQVEAALMAAAPEIVRVVSRSGSDEIGLDPMGLNESDMFLQLKPIGEWEVPSKQALEDKLRVVMEGFPGINFAFTQPIDMRVSEMLTGSRGDVAIKIFGTDLDALNRYADEVSRVIDGVDGSIDTIATINEGAQYLQISVDRLRAGRQREHRRHRPHRRDLPPRPRRRRAHPHPARLQQTRHGNHPLVEIPRRREGHRRGFAAPSVIHRRAHRRLRHELQNEPAAPHAGGQ